jgi:hypothetical protein
MAITTVGRAKELEEAKKKIIKLNPMGKTAQKEAAMKKFPKRKFNAKALIKSLEDKNAPMKKARLEDSVRGKKMVFKKSGSKKDPNDVILKKEKPEPKRVPEKQKEMIPLRPKGMILMAKGGRAGFKSGSKGCKLAMKGKGRAYGKNS